MFAASWLKAEATTASARGDIKGGLGRVSSDAANLALGGSRGRPDTSGTCDAELDRGRLILIVRCVFRLGNRILDRLIYGHLDDIVGGRRLGHELQQRLGRRSAWRRLHRSLGEQPADIGGRLDRFRHGRGRVLRTSSSEIMRRMDARISSMVCSCAWLSLLMSLGGRMAIRALRIED